MVKVKEMFDEIADRIQVPRATAFVHYRTAREAKQLSQFGRGRNAIEATARDAAAGLIALIACPNPARAADYIRDFGGLKCSDLETYRNRDEDAPTPARMIFSPGETFLEGLASLLASLGRPEYAEAIAPSLDRLPDGRWLPPRFSMEIRDTALAAMLHTPGVAGRYAHPSVSNLEGKVGGELFRAVAENSEAVAKYYRGVMSVKSIGTDIIVPVAATRNGVHFHDLTSDALEDIAAGRGYSNRVGVDGYPIDPRHPLNRKSGAE